MASLRLKAYGLPAGSSVLDVGSGNGAFVIRCREAGLDAWGCEIAKEVSRTPYTYNQDLREVSFPTDHFSVVTSHDLLEHLLEPMEWLAEVFRIVKQEGRFILDVPFFDEKKGRHHWRPEHLWYFTPDQVKEMLVDTGFTVRDVHHPIPSKTVFDCWKPKQTRPTLLVPPGIGDIYWPMTKVQSFLRKKGLPLPDVFITSTDAKKDRSWDYVHSIPFVNAAGYVPVDASEQVYQEAYQTDGRSIFKDVAGCDHFLSYNGVLRFGRVMEQVDPEYDTDWFFPVWEPLEARWFAEQFREKMGPYIVGYFPPYGMYQHWLDEFSCENISETLNQIVELTGKKVILMGREWDKTELNKYLVSKGRKGFILNMTGETSLQEAFSLLRGTDGVLGFPSGLTIMTTRFKRPTLMLWNDLHFHPDFFWSSCPPAAREQWYKALPTRGTSVGRVVEDFQSLTQEKVYVSTGVKQLKIRGALEAFRRGLPAGNPAPSNKVTVCCVLKSGGDYNADEYVERLMSMVHKHLPIPHDFVCLSDMDVPCRRIPLKHGWPGWWSKLELFRPGVLKGKLMYFDLDTVILGDLKALAEFPGQFAMVKGFSPHRDGAMSSTIMAWQQTELTAEIYRKAVKVFSPSFPAEPPTRSDQEFIQACLKEHNINPVSIQNLISIASYKRDWVEKGKFPEDLRVVCFHGHPRPHELAVATERPEWFEENWK